MKENESRTGTGRRAYPSYGGLDTRLYVDLPAKMCFFFCNVLPSAPCLCVFRPIDDADRQC